MIQQEKGNKIKRWKRGNEMIRNSNPKRWMDKQIGEITDLTELEEKADLINCWRRNRNKTRNKGESRGI